MVNRRCNFRETEMWSLKKPRKLKIMRTLMLEIQRVWNVKTEVTPVLIGTTGTISKSFIKYPTKMAGKRAIKELQ